MTRQSEQLAAGQRPDPQTSVEMPVKRPAGQDLAGQEPVSPELAGQNPLSPEPAGQASAGQDSVGQDPVDSGQVTPELPSPESAGQAPKGVHSEAALASVCPKEQTAPQPEVALASGPYRPAHAMPLWVMLLVFLGLLAVVLTAIWAGGNNAVRLLAALMLLGALARAFSPDGMVPWARRRGWDVVTMLLLSWLLLHASYPWWPFN